MTLCDILSTIFDEGDCMLHHTETQSNYWFDVDMHIHNHAQLGNVHVLRVMMVGDVLLSIIINFINKMFTFMGK